MANHATTEPSRRKRAVSVRPMEIDDLPTVFHLGERLFTSQETPNLYRVWDEYEVVGLFYDDAEYCFVAEQGSKIVGFALGTTIEKSRSAWKYGYVVWMGIDQSCQRSGIGEKLFTAVQDAMLEAGVRMLMADTAADNLPAISFLKKLGFGNAEGHVYMTLNLSQMQRELKEKNEEEASAQHSDTEPTRRGKGAKTRPKNRRSKNP